MTTQAEPRKSIYPPHLTGLSPEETLTAQVIIGNTRGEKLAEFSGTGPTPEAAIAAALRHIRVEEDASAHE